MKATSRLSLRSKMFLPNLFYLIPLVGAGYMLIHTGNAIREFCGVQDSVTGLSIQIREIALLTKQMDKVTQQNAGLAEESSAAAQELAAQTQTVKGLIDDLVGPVGGSRMHCTTG